MKHSIAILAAFALTVASLAAVAQENAAAERARIANQRIAAEAERRARAEAESQSVAARSQTAAELAATPATAATSPAPAPASSAPVREQAMPIAAPPASATRATVEPPPVERRNEGANSDMPRLLEQLKTLGELRDAGYVTEEEFERIKQRLLGEQL